MIYVHVPFCKSFCTYCDFYSEICRNGDSQQVQTFLSSLRDEVGRRIGNEPAFRGNPRTLYIGGGTPSVLPVEAIREISDMLGDGPWEEFTVEVNPDDITPVYAAGLRSTGVNRISMGVQSLDDGILNWMNRRHSAGGAEKAFKALREVGFDNISVDIIFGLSQLSDAALSSTIDRIISWHPEHISAYQLSIEEGSALSSLISRGLYKEASDEQCADQYSLLCSRLSKAGYHHYEISNWALPGREAVHNAAYWSRMPYVGLGPGAHSLEGINRRSWNSDSLPDWTSSFEVLSQEEIDEETLMLGLRRDIGLPESFLKTLAGETAFDAHIASGDLQRLPGGRIRIPESRWFVSDDIISSLQ